MKLARTFVLAVALSWSLLIVPATSGASEVTLTWTEPTLNEDGSPLTDLAEYEIHYGCSQSGQYDSLRFVTAPATSTTITALPDVGNCYFAAKAVDSEGTKSVFSGELVESMGSIPLPGTVDSLQISWQESQGIYALTETDFPPYIDAGTWNLNPGSMRIDFEITPRSWPVNDSRIISKASSSSTQGHIFMVSMRNEKIRFRLKTNGFTDTLLGNQIIPLNQKTVGYVEYDGSQMRIVIDGVVDASMSKTGQIDQSADPVFVGAQPPDAAGPFDGLIKLSVN